ncbi:MAG: signal peptide peptidase SppA [Cyclobacteriaceae bacterium]|nr:signal peptide peptidase SppA [Cyclobacteriaceae bacterium]
MKFLRNLLATITGLFVFCFLCVLFIAIIVASSEDKVVVKENSILHLNLNRAILEKERNDPFSDVNFFTGESNRPIGLYELKKAISQAKDDDKIKGIFLELNAVGAGYAVAEDIRNALADFKESGKFIISYSEFYSEGAYYVASISDTIITNPDFGLVEFNGLSANMLYLKGTFEKLDLEPYIFRTGDYKSAIEPFINDKMSEEAREQTTEYIEGIYNYILNAVASSRGLDYERAKEISNEMLVRRPEDALKYGLVDMLGYRDEVDALLREKLGIDEKKDLPLVKYRRYNKSYSEKNISRNRIAVIVAEGDIMMGKSQPGTIGSETMAQEIRKARKDKNTKAIVLRINSPGGSAYASDVIWREIILATKEKPVIASMSDLAASGGYYLAMACDSIVANPNTLTGSIGVFSVLFNAEKMLKNKLGITTDHVATGKFSDLGNLSRKMTDAEKEFFQQSVDHVYDLFISKVSEGRSLPTEDVLKVASGRVWTGQKALSNGLADVLGNLDDAIAIAAEKAGVADDYRVRLYPVEKPAFEQLLQNLSEDVESRYLKLKLGDWYPYAKQINNLQRFTGIQTRFPIEPVNRF